MTEKEIGELRRRLRPDKCTPTALYGCFVNEQKQIATDFRQTLTTTSGDDLEALLALMRKTLSGVPGRSLIPVPFSNEQVIDSDEHRLFMALKNGGDENETAIRRFFEKTAEGLQMEGNYVILLLQDAYPVPLYAKDGANNDEGREIFGYALCAVCPVKETKPALSFSPTENAIRSLMANRVIANPEIGFLFPSFDDRTANIYDLLYYVRKPDENHPEFIENVVNAAPPMPADEQKEAFEEALGETLGKGVSLKFAMDLRDAICEEIEEAKNDPEADAPVVDRGTVTRVLRDAGAEEAQIEAFGAAYEARFGKAALPPQNVVNTKQIEVSTPEVQIRIASDRSDLISSRVIDGVHYLLIRAESTVEVNGMPVEIDG